VTETTQTLKPQDVARQAGVSVATLRRWQRDGLIPHGNGRWTSAAAAQARIVARLRARGHSLAEIREATQTGRLAFGYLEELFPALRGGVSVEEAARETGLEPALIHRIFSTVGFSNREPEQLSEDDVQFLRYVAAVLAAGFPLVAFLQLVRVYGHALAQISDAEVRLFHLYVHEPLMRDGVPGIDMAEEMDGLARDILPLASPIMDFIHQRFLGHFVEQDVIGHMEVDLGDDPSPQLGRLRVAIAFADLAGYTRMTEEQGDEEAVNAVERFIAGVESTLPDEARVIKTIGDEVMIVGSDAATLTDWAVEFQAMQRERPLPRIGMHVGETLYRDGDYYGREVNLAARVAARAAGGEGLVTQPVVDAAGSRHEFQLIGEVRLKGFAEPTELYVARTDQE